MGRKNYLATSKEFIAFLGTSLCALVTIDPCSFAQTGESMPEQLDPTAGERPDPKTTEIELTIPELLAFALKLHRNGRFAEAEKCYRALLQVDPDNPNAIHYLGVLLWTNGKSDESLELIRKSIAVDPMVASWHNNLGNVLLETGHYEAAATSYALCSELDPENLEVLNNLGSLLRKLGRPQEAEVMLLRAIRCSPGFGDAHANLASLYGELGRLTEAFSLFAEALALKPKDGNTRRLLVVAYGHAGRRGDGLKACLEWLKLEPDNAQALHLRAALGGAVAPDRASDRYVEQEFDGFAKSFDAKLAELDYRAPELVGEAVSRLRAAEDQSWNVLDLGCGTGLCGPYLRPFASQLVGIDLSGNMLERARERGLYDDLVKCELVSFLMACEVIQDLVVSADTLCYFGRLDAVFSEVCRTLRPEGHWVFTVEAHDDPTDFELQVNGRYSHSRRYVESELDRAGFHSVDMREVELRFEMARPVAGWLVSAKALGHASLN